MEDTVNPSSSWQLIGINLVAGAFDTFLKVHSKLLDHPTRKQKAGSRRHGWTVASREGHAVKATHWSRALVLRAGSSGRKFLYSSTSFSMERSWLWSLFLSPGSVSRMWLVNCCRGKRFKIKAVSSYQEGCAMSAPQNKEEYSSLAVFSEWSNPGQIPVISLVYPAFPSPTYFTHLFLIFIFCFSLTQTFYSDKPVNSNQE